ncbi:solute carrier family 23 protein [Desertibacillus haloalkaliphilus]|uniref:solute carrier family 23 protein n=1 Tax=Desertibacillus haloalkaliphilus TaxID=1328930 RepID=UPI001C25C266|nr:solute carrier family 23 protein [Desertibacillus haloalkaliphilus]MBU8908011.1 hypothetical protein [Desertibacillus haloalkaliphilus]
MRKKRPYGGIQPGIKWGPFTMRVPGVHVGFSWSIAIQGAFLSLATGGALAPLMMEFFAIPFEVAWSMLAIQLFWVWSQTLLFGDAYTAGWITPALPLIIVFLGGFTPGPEAVQAMIAVTLVVSVLFLFFGLTGLGEKFNTIIPTTLKAGIIMGAAIAAFQSELDRVQELPFTLISAWIVVLVLMFSIPFSRLPNTKIKVLMVSNAILAGFIVSAIVGIASGELAFNIEWGIFVPQIGELLATTSPWGVGWPSLSMIIASIPISIMVYVLVFGDLLVADTLLKEANKARKDETIDVNHTRTHISLFIRNIGQMFTGGVLIPLHGAMWTGIQVFVIERYKSSKKAMDSIFTGTINWYLLALPLVFLTPMIGIMLPLLPVALSLTLLLTGFACAYVAMGMVTDNVSRGLALAIGMLTAIQGPAWGIGAGVLLYFILIGKKRIYEPSSEEDEQKSA